MHQSPRRGSSGLSAAFNPLATLSALLGAIFVGPSIWPAIEPTVWQFLTSQYDHDTAFWLAWCIRIGTFPLAFTLIRLALLIGFTSLTAFTARRLM